MPIGILPDSPFRTDVSDGAGRGVRMTEANHMRFIAFCCFMFLGPIADLAALMNDDPQPDPPLVTMEASLERSSLRASSVRWANANTLIASFIAADDDKTFARLLQLDGTLSDTMSESDLSALAPDGEAILESTNDRWVLRELDAVGQTVDIDEEKDGENEFLFSALRPPEWSPDSRYAAIVERRAPRPHIGSHETIEVNGVSIIEFDRYSSSVTRRETRIRIIDRAAGRTVRQFVISGSAMRLAWGTDCSLYVSQVQSFAIDHPSTTLLRFNLYDDKPRRIYHTLGRLQSMRPAIHPDGELIALAIDVENRKWDDFVSLVLIDAKSGKEARRLTHNIPISGEDYYWSTDGSEIYTRVRRGGLDEVWAIPLDGKPRPLAQGPRRHFNLDLSPNGKKVSYQTEDGYGRKDIRVLDLETGKEKIVLVLDEPARDFRLGEWRQIRWKSSDGVHPYGFLFLPPDFDPHRHYPMLVYVHGGGAGSRLYLDAPFTQRIAKGPLEWHAWAALGYVVFMPDYRSTGDYGPKVITARYNKGEPSLVDDVKDIAAGARHVISQGFIDPTRVAILGHSAGGARVYFLLTQHCGIFAAAIINEGIPPDPVSIFINSATGAFVGGFPAGILSDLYGGTLAQVPDKYKVNYMFDAYRIKTPTLILLGAEESGGVPHMPYEVLYSILKEYRIPARMLSFVEEGHNYANPSAARLAFDEARQWLKTHMPADERAQAH